MWSMKYRSEMGRNCHSWVLCPPKEILRSIKCATVINLKDYILQNPYVDAQS